MKKKKILIKNNKNFIEEKTIRKMTEKWKKFKSNEEFNKYINGSKYGN